MEFFAQPDAWPERKRDEAPSFLVQRGSPANDRVLSTLRGVNPRNEPIPRWGINE